uniref:Uncharacterized protein n=1 Tax=Mammaliicoccus phage MSShimriz1 TaxID=3230127 RepID=A0AAU8GVV8_9VIRU
MIIKELVQGFVANEFDRMEDLKESAVSWLQLTEDSYKEEQAQNMQDYSRNIKACREAMAEVEDADDLEVINEWLSFAGVQYEVEAV